jgi:hypothetical protein
MNISILLLALGVLLARLAAVYLAENPHQLARSRLAIHRRQSGTDRTAR